MRFLFFLLGLPMMMLSFFEVADVVPLANQASLLVDGTVIELSNEQQSEFNEKVCALFEGSRTLPAYGVALHNEFVESVQEGTYVCLTYAMPMEVNGLKFDQLVFEISCDQTSFNIVRGNHGIFQGRCLFVDLGDGTMQELCDFVDGLEIPSDDGLDEEYDDSDEQDENGEQEDGGEQGGETTESGDNISGGDGEMDENDESTGDGDSDEGTDFGENLLETQENLASGDENLF